MHFDENVCILGYITFHIWKNILNFFDENVCILGYITFHIWKNILNFDVVLEIMNLNMIQLYVL
jgi:hypothetical protein